jgi:ABC-type transport system involved in multi-copper enzyme maturation permease subunit
VILTLAIFTAGKPKAPMPAEVWIDYTVRVWQIAGLTLGRYFIAAYFALVFAGEYGWNTWKLVVPHTARWKLIASKYAVALALLYSAWLVTAAITLLLNWAKAVVTGIAIPEGVTAATLLDGHLTAIALGIAPLLLAAAYASIAAVLTRSTLAAFIISLVLITIDEIFGKLMSVMSAFGLEWLAAPYRVLPGYHLDNLTSWMQEGVGHQVKLASGAVVAYSQAVSAVALIAWIAGLVALTFWVFRRQDIN